MPPNKLCRVFLVTLAQVNNCYHPVKVCHLIVFSANFQGKVSKSPISRRIRRDKTKISTCPSFAYFNELQLNYFGSLKLLKYTHLTCKLCTHKANPWEFNLFVKATRTRIASMQKCIPFVFISVFNNGWATIYTGAKNTYGAILSRKRKPITDKPSICGKISKSSTSR